MKVQSLSLVHMNVVDNIKQIRLQKGISQEIIAEALHLDGSVISNIESGKRELKVKELEVIARCLGVSEIDLFTYPKRYVEAELIDKSAEKVSVTFEVSPDKRDYLLKLVLGK